MLYACDSRGFKCVPGICRLLGWPCDHSQRSGFLQTSKPPEKTAECNVPHVLRLPPTFEFDVYFSNSLIHYQVKAKKMATVKEVWTPGLNKHRFWRFHFFVYSLVEHTSNTRDNVSSAIQTLRISSKILRRASYFQLSSWCLDIPMRHCLSCLMYNVTNPCQCQL